MERPPTKRQLAYIRLLARKVGASLYLGNIKTMEEASKTIDTLKIQRRMAYKSAPVSSVPSSAGNGGA